MKNLIAGQGQANVQICNACVTLCKGIVDDVPAVDAPTATFADMRPKAIREYLDEHIIGQDKAKVGLSVAVYNHFKRIRDNENDDVDEEDDTELSKGNVLMIGPTGTGKTLFARTIAKKLGVPFTIADATTLTQAGYVGEDVESIVKNLWLAANKDAALASQGIVCVDEVDKIARASSASGSVRDVGGEGVQQALLKIVEGQVVTFQPDGARRQPQAETVDVDTKNVLFICCGAFVGLEDIVQRRLAHAQIGFGGTARKETLTRSQILQRVRGEDLVQFGLIPEFVGRVPVIITLDELSERDLVEILWKPKNAIVKQYQRLLELQGVKLRFESDALDAIVTRALERKSGARGLRSIVEDVMLDVMYELPSLEHVGECVITAASVNEGAKPLLLPKSTDAA